jgi:hypothetical protein
MDEDLARASPPRSTHQARTTRPWCRASAASI